MGPSRTELMQFKVTPYEKKVIEDFVENGATPFPSMCERRHYGYGLGG